jgi:hypothetical protein
MVNTRQNSPSTTASGVAQSLAPSTTPTQPGDDSFFDLPPVPESTTDPQEYPRSDSEREQDEEVFDDAGSQATQDTEGIENPTNSGTFHYDADMCLVIMSTKSGGSKLCCGYKAAACTRPRHSDIRKDGDRRGKPGIYVGIPNSTGTTYDAVLSSFVDPEEQQRQRDSDRLAATVFAQSQVKARAEALHSPKAGNTTVAFDLSRQPSPFKKSTPASVTIPRPLTIDTVNLAPASAAASRNGPTSNSHATRTPSLPNRFPLPPPAASTTSTKAVAPPSDPLIERFEVMHSSMTKLMNAQLAIMEKLSQTQEVKTKGTSKQNDDIIDISDDEEPRSSKSQKSMDRDPHVAKRIFYAVARGHTPGIFTTWKKARKSIHGFKGALHKSFESRREATIWLSKQWREDNGSSSEEDSSSESDSGHETKRNANNPEGKTSKYSKGTFVQIADPSHAGADPSVGKPDELYNTAIDVEVDVLGVLCPKGISKEVQRELMETAVDVVSLPGKLSNTEANGGMDQLAATLGELSSFEARRAGFVARDTQWQAKNRNALDRIKTLEDLINGTEELSTQRDRVMSNMGSNMCEVLMKAGWTSSDSKMFVEAGLLPRIIRATMDQYFYLLLHLRHLSAGPVTNWTNIGRIHLLHHATQLRNIRTYAVRRSQVLLQVYTYLRDSSAAGFMSLKLFGKVTSQLRETVSGQKSASATTGDAKAHLCAHCNSSIVHEGGTEDCVLMKFKQRRARAIARVLFPKITNDPDGREEIVNEAIQEEEAKG